MQIWQKHASHPMIENVLQLQSDFIFNHDVTNGVSQPVIMI
jgi:hypothetical protein